MFRKIGLILIAIALFAGLFTSCASQTSTTTPAAATSSAPTTTEARATTTAAAPTPTTTPAPTTTPPPATITVTDQYNRTVTVKAYPQRIISLSPANTEILFALGLDSRIIGVSDYSDYPAAAATKTNIGAYDSPNIEKIISLEPDLVVATEEHEAAVDQLSALGIPVLAVNPTSVNEVFDAIKLIGKVTGQDTEAAAVVNDMQTRIAKITDITGKLQDYQKPRVLMVIWYDPIWTVGANTFHDELIKMAGGVNVAGNLNGYTTISMEDVIYDDPQIIIAGVGMGDDNATLNAMTTDARLAGTDARKSNAVYGTNMDIISRPGPRLVDALEALFKLIHPELAQELK